MKTLTTVLLTFYAYCALAQWNGSTTSTGTTYRSGNVSIGPVSSIPGYASLYLSNNGGLNPNLMFDNGDAPADSRIWSMMAQGGSFRLLTQLDQGGSIRDALIISRSGIEITKVLFPNGKVGIGTTTPAYNLDVNGGTRIVNGDGQALVIEKNDGDSWMTFHDPGEYWYSMGISRSNNGAFTLNPGGTLVGGNGSFVMTSDGLIGIGTSVPDEKLTIKGKVHSEEVKVNLSVPGPDYVFEEGYDLPSLSEIEAFVKQNKHLPEVPPAKEMEQDGIKLGEMNMLLLKKVEELTLYVIELKKEIEELKSSKLDK